MNVFSVFSNCTAEVGNMTVCDGYADDDNTFVAEASFDADVQPYNGGLALREYGYEGEVTAKLYTAPTDGVLAGGKKVRVKNVIYDVVYAENWELGDVALLRRIDKEDILC